MKQISLSPALLASVLKTLAPAATQKHIIPILDHVHIFYKEQQIQFAASSGSGTITVKLAYSTEMEPFAFLAPYQQLRNLAGVLNSEITLRPEEGTLYVTSGKEEFKLPSPNAADYVFAPAMHKKMVFDLPLEYLPALDTAMDTVHNDQLRPAMTQVLMERSEESISLISTDSHSMFMYGANSHVNYDEVLIPTDLIKAIKGLTPEKVEVAFSKSHVLFTLGNTTIQHVLVDAKFPDYRPYFAPAEANIVIDLAEWLIALQKLTAIRTLKFSPITDISITDNEFMMSISNIDSQLFSKAAVNIQNLGCKVEAICLNADLVMRTLKQFAAHGVKKLALTITSPYRPIICTTTEAPIKALIMPFGKPEQNNN